MTEALFLRLLGLVYLCAFGSLWPQILGLAGSRGIVPAARMLDAVHGQYGARAFYLLPTLCWFNSSDRCLLALCIFGCICALLLIWSILPRVAAAACFVCYLSLVTVGEPFTSFQWDGLLLEAGFLAIFAGAPWLVWAYRFLLFRLMFESGVVKLSSHDPNWRNLHALRFHFMTQPLPNPVAYYVHWAPHSLLDMLTALALVIELGAPFALFLPRRPRYIGLALIALLQLVILFTGNYAFFNWLTLALCVWGLEDRDLARFAPRIQWRWPQWRFARAVPRLRAFANVAVAILLALGVIQLLELLAPRVAGPISQPLTLVQSFEIVNGYGLFAIMTVTRPEIIIEGSNDAEHWREYEFLFKPVNTHRRLPWVAPYQPRLDWQMWFAALGDYQNNTWMNGFMYRVLTGEPSVLRLLNTPPFARPPRYLRALLYEYSFTTPAERARTGAIWQRKLRGTWFGPVSLNGQ